MGLKNIEGVLNKSRIRIEMSNGHVKVICPDCAHRDAAHNALQTAVDSVKVLFNDGKLNGLRNGFPFFEYEFTIDPQFNKDLKELNNSPSAIEEFTSDFQVSLVDSVIRRAEEIVEFYGACPEWGKDDVEQLSEKLESFKTSNDVSLDSASKFTRAFHETRCDLQKIKYQAKMGQDPNGPSELGSEPPRPS